MSWFRNVKVAAARAAAPGFGTCLRCDMPWQFVSGHSTSYNDHSGCFPLCESCWEELGTPEARLPFYRELWVQWQSYGDPDHNGTPWPEVWEQMRSAVEAGK